MSGEAAAEAVAREAAAELLRAETWVDGECAVGRVHCQGVCARVGVVTSGASGTLRSSLSCRGASPYAEGWRYCATCVAWMKRWIWCPCCGRKLRTGTASKSETSRRRVA